MKICLTCVVWEYEKKTNYVIKVCSMDTWKEINLFDMSVWNEINLRGMVYVWLWYGINLYGMGAYQDVNLY